MKILVCRLIAALLIAAMLSGCAAVVQESAMEWLARQPQNIDDP